MKSKTYVNGTKYILDAEFNNGSIVTLISHGNIYGKVKGDESEWETMLNRLTEIPEWAKPYIASQFQHPVHNEAGEVYVWVKAMERLPDIDNKNPKHYLFLNEVNHHAIDIWTEFITNFPPLITSRLFDWKWLSPAPPSGEGAGKGWISEIDKARFWIKVSQTETCWEWLGAKNNDGYGNFRIGSDYISAHKCSFKIINGDVPDNLCVLHSCDNPSCVNPTHLFLGTHDDNMKDKVAKGRSRVQGKSSKYIGVGLRNDSNTWRAYYYNNGKMQWIGTYKTELEAAKERDKYIIENNIKEKLNFNN